MSNHTSTSGATIIGASVLIFLVGIALVGAVILGFFVTIDTWKIEHFAATIGMAVLATIWWVQIITLLSEDEDDER